MSVQFGRWNFDGRPLSPDYIVQIRRAFDLYGPDSGDCYSDGYATFLYRAFHTTPQSRRECQPYVSQSGNVLTWDGRLDNRVELLRELDSAAPPDDLTDVELVATAYDRWGTCCFAKLIGDWAVAIWNPGPRSLTLAKDFIGTRSLYYSIERDHVVWSSIIDPIVAQRGNTRALCEEYIAGWLAFFPAVHLTPYEGIRCVPPASFVSLTGEHQKTIRFWDFDPARRIRYRTDAEYEDHFRSVFAAAVSRRLRSDSPVLCELSGGMDSSSIVCVADDILASGHAETPRIDTISYYDDFEPNWNERLYFSKVEEKRGHVGWHIDVGAEELAGIELDCDDFTSMPGAGGKKLSSAARQLSACFSSQKYRVLLSGVGGDEVTGGVPTAVPELQDYMSQGDFSAFARQLKAWALQKRKPWVHLLWECVRDFLPAILAGVPQANRAAPWLQPAFIKRNRAALGGYRVRTKILGALPSFQANMGTLDCLRRQLACDVPGCEPLYERRYPFLDRTFLEFIFAIPREQLIRPGQRRSLMRRALSGIVPQEILNRKRKGFVMRRPMAALSRQWPQLIEFSEHMAGASLGIVDANLFQETLTRAEQGTEIPTVKVLRTLEIERWLRSWRRYMPTELPASEELNLQFRKGEGVAGALVGADRKQDLWFQPKG